MSWWKNTYFIVCLISAFFVNGCGGSHLSTGGAVDLDGKGIFVCLKNILMRRYKSLYSCKLIDLKGN